MADTDEIARAAWNRVHLAVIRDELWSPACTEERGWVAPLADRSLAGQITCEACHRIAMPDSRLYSDPQKVTP